MEGKRQGIKGKRQKAKGKSLNERFYLEASNPSERRPICLTGLSVRARYIANRCLFGFAFLLLPFAFCLEATAQENFAGGKPVAMKFGYKFENPRFYIPLIEVDLDAKGEGEVRFKRGESDDVIDLKLKLLPETLARIQEIYANTRFLETEENYQDKKDHSNIGWVTLTVSAGERQRSARFNYTPNLEIKEVAEIFRALANQQMDLFDIETALQYQPLDVPGKLEVLENDLRLERIAEPPQVLQALRDFAKNDSAPLIARNHAKRIIEAIEKGKYKSPIKK
jgi:hypothetical protein